MPNFSKDPQTVLAANLARGYVGVHVEQGVPVLDRDLNLLGDLLGASLRGSLSAVLGDGTPSGASDQFQIHQCWAPLNDFQLTAGRILVRGVELSTATHLYSALGGPPLVAPVGTRTDIVYLDVWFTEVDSLNDPALFHADEYELATSVRVQPRWAVKVAEGVPVPAPLPGHDHLPLARLARNGAGITEAMITDLRQRDLGVPAQLQQVSAGEGFIAGLRRLLTPSFAAQPFSAAYGFPGMTLVLAGRRFDRGDLSIKMARFPVTTWVDVPIVGSPTANAVTVRIPPDVSGEVVVRAENEAGWGGAGQSIYVYGPPQFLASGSQFSKSYAISSSEVTLFGNFFHAPGVIVEWGATDIPGVWKKATIKSATPTSITVVAPSTPDTYQARVRTFASPVAAVSSDTLAVIFLL